MARQNSLFSDEDVLDIMAALVHLQTAVGAMVHEIESPEQRVRAAAAHEQSTSMIDNLLKRLDKKNNG